MYLGIKQALRAFFWIIIVKGKNFAIYGSGCSCFCRETAE